MAEEKDKKLIKSLSRTYPLFFKTFTQAKSSQDEILKTCRAYDSVYVIIAEEGDMDDTEILTLHKAIKLYAGSAWTQIHKGRLEEGLYLAVSS